MYIKYLQHYKKHALSDVVLLDDYWRRVARALRSQPIRVQPGAGSSKHQIHEDVRKTIDRVHIPYDLDRATAPRKIDNDVELDTLKKLCRSEAAGAGSGQI